MTIGLSTYAQNALLDHAFGATAYSPAANVHGGLHTGALLVDGTGTEVSGGSYTRKSITNNATNFPAAVALVKLLHVAQQFVQATANWGTPASWGLWDASSSGHLLVKGNPAALSIVTGEIPSFAADALSLTLGGGISTYLGNKLLDLLLSGAAYSAPANVYLAAFVASVEVSGNNYSRRAIANDTTQFPNASAGAKSNGAAITMATPSGSWGTVDQFKLYDASTSGNLLCTFTPATTFAVVSGVPIQIGAGDMAITLNT